MFDSVQEDSTKCAPQYRLNSSAAMATYWVPDLPNINILHSHIMQLKNTIILFSQGKCKILKLVVIKDYESAFDAV